MDTSVFTNITFGDIFITKNKTRVFFIKKRYDGLLEFIIEGNDIPSKYTSDGKIKPNEESPYDIEYKLNDIKSIEEYSQQLGQIEAEKWYKSVTAIFDKMTDTEKQEYNQYITFEVFADTLSQYIAKFVNIGYNKALEDNKKS